MMTIPGPDSNEPEKESAKNVKDRYLKTEIREKKSNAGTNSQQVLVKKVYAEDQQINQEQVQHKKTTVRPKTAIRKTEKFKSGEGE